MALDKGSDVRKDNVIGLVIKGLTLFGCFKLTNEGPSITSGSTVGTLFGNILDQLPK